MGVQRGSSKALLFGPRQRGSFGVQGMRVTPSNPWLTVRDRGGSSVTHIVSMCLTEIVQPPAAGPISPVNEGRAQFMSNLTYAERMRSDGFYPVVLRFADIHPDDVSGIIMHAERRGGDLSHIDFSRTKMNQDLVGGPEIASQIRREMTELAEYNFESNIAGLTALGRKKDLARAQKRGPRDPWISQKKCKSPLREGILTLHRDFFKADENCPAKHLISFIDDQGNPTAWDRRRCDRFVSASLAFLKEEFGGALRYCRADFDEQSVHLQFVICDVVQEPASGRYAHGRKLFRTSHFPCIGGVGDRRKGYEVAQDRVAAFFGRPEHRDMKIVRGESRAKRQREAVEAVQEIVLEAFFGDEPLPAGSENAQAMHILKKKVSEAGTLRKDSKQQLALEYLQSLGLVSKDRVSEASTRRARAALLEEHEEYVGTLDEIISKPEKALAVAEDLLAEKEKAAMQRVEKAAQKVMRDAQKAAAEEARREEKHRQRLAAVERWEREKRAEIRRWSDALHKRESALNAREGRVIAREREVDRILKELKPLAGAISDAARRLGLVGNAVIDRGVRAAKRVAEIVRQR